MGEENVSGDINNDLDSPTAAFCSFGANAPFSIIISKISKTLP